MLSQASPLNFNAIHPPKTLFTYSTNISELVQSSLTLSRTCSRKVSSSLKIFYTKSTFLKIIYTRRSSCLSGIKKLE